MFDFPKTQDPLMNETPSSPHTHFALFASLIAYPLLYSTDFFGNLLLPLLPDRALSTLLDPSNRLEWWYFWISNMLFHWIPFGLIALALHKTNQGWSSLGLDWSFFSRHRGRFGLLLLVLVLAAFIMPEIHYGSDLPTHSTTIFIGPVSTLERLFLILGAATAGITEEVLFRGFALHQLKRWMNPWLALPITVLAFILIHGEPRSLGQVLNYTLAGLAFGVPFLLMRLQRLERIILVHFLIDVTLVLAP